METEEKLCAKHAVRMSTVSTKYKAHSWLMLTLGNKILVLVYSKICIRALILEKLKSLLIKNVVIKFKSK